MPLPAMGYNGYVFCARKQYSRRRLQHYGVKYLIHPIKWRRKIANNRLHSVKFDTMWKIRLIIKILN